MNTTRVSDVLLKGVKMKRIISTAALLLLLTGCSSETEVTDKLEIVTTYYPYQLVTEEIGGDYVEVSSIYPTDSDAHSYELTPKQTIELQDADLVIISNPEEDSKIYSMLEDKDNLLVLENDEHADEEDETSEHAHSHTWLSPLHMSDDIDTIASALIDLDNSNKAAYQGAVSTLSSKLASISDEYAEFGQEQTKQIIATHDAYDALDDDYGIEFTTLYGQHHDDEPTTKEVLSVVDLIKEQKIKTIFVEQDDTANSVIRQIADETGANVDTIFTLETESSLKSFDSITDFYEYNLKMMKASQN